MFILKAAILPLLHRTLAGTHFPSHWG